MTEGPIVFRAPPIVSFDRQPASREDRALCCFGFLDRRPRWNRRFGRRREDDRQLAEREKDLYVETRPGRGENGRDRFSVCESLGNRSSSGVDPHRRSISEPFANDACVRGIEPFAGANDRLGGERGFARAAPTLGFCIHRADFDPSKARLRCFAAGPRCNADTRTRPGRVRRLGSGFAISSP